MCFSNVTILDEVESTISDTLDCSTEGSLQDHSLATVEQVLLILQSAGWDFSSLKDSATIINNTEVAKIAHTGRGPAPSWDLNYPAIVSLMNGQYYVEYHSVFGMKGTQLCQKLHG